MLLAKRFPRLQALAQSTLPALHRLDGHAPANLVRQVELLVEPQSARHHGSKSFGFHGSFSPHRGYLSIILLLKAMSKPLYSQSHPGNQKIGPSLNAEIAFDNCLGNKLSFRL
jgi:hypothetical protein